MCKCQVNTKLKCNLTIVLGLFALDILVGRKGEGEGEGKIMCHFARQVVNVLRPPLAGWNVTETNVK